MIEITREQYFKLKEIVSDKNAVFTKSYKINGYWAGKRYYIASCLKNLLEDIK